LAFFSDDVPCERKQAMFEALHIPGKKQKSKRLDGKGVIGTIGSMELEGVITEASKELFKKLGTDTVFVTQHRPILHRHGLDFSSIDKPRKQPPV
jgi:hypothetical protein